VPTARYGPPDRPTGLLLQQIADSGAAPDVDDDLRAIAREDLAYWHAGALVLMPDVDNVDALRGFVDQLLAEQGVFVDGVWVWKVRDGS
jgi:hypothetical protein